MPARIEQELDELAAWQEARGVRRKSVLSYASRIRRFAEWFEEERGRHITAANVTDDVLRAYERHLRETCATWTQVVSATSAVRQYNRWAVETGRLPRGKLLRAKVIADRKLRVEKARSPKEFDLPPKYVAFTEGASRSSADGSSSVGGLWHIKGHE